MTTTSTNSEGIFIFIVLFLLSSVLLHWNLFTHFLNRLRICVAPGQQQQSQFCVPFISKILVLIPFLVILVFYLIQFHLAMKSRFIVLT